MMPRSTWTLALRAALFAVVLFVFAAPAFPQGRQQLAPQNADTQTPEAIIRRFAEKEAEFYRRFKDYSFKRDITVQVIGMGKQIAGEYRRVSQLTIDPQGNMIERVKLAPISTLIPTAEDMKDFATIQTFAIEPSKIGDYDFTFVGKERIDELDAYVFDVKPKVLRDPKLTKLALKNKDRFFEGRVWIDTQDFQLVKARGRGVPEGKQRYPTFETYREQVDGKFWFPSYTYGDDELVYPDGSVQRVRLRVKFTDYEPHGGGKQTPQVTTK